MKLNSYWKQEGGNEVMNWMIIDCGQWKEKSGGECGCGQEKRQTRWERACGEWQTS